MEALVNPELHSLLAGVRAAPLDDAPRLVLADWLEEHATGEADRARAELIRAQCHVSLLNWIAKPAFDADVDRHVRGLIQKHADEWLEPLGDLASEAFFVRGTTWVFSKETWFLEHGPC